jgi:predicted esterase
VRAARAALVFALAACGESARDPSAPARSSEVATPTPSSSGAASPPAPVVPVVCDGGDVDVDGACVHLPDGVNAAMLRSSGRLGFWNAWSTIVPLPAATAQKIRDAGGDLAPAGGAKSAKPTCPRDGWVGGASGDRAKHDRLAAHAVVAIASRDVEADLWGSVSGDLEVWIGGREAARYATVPGGDGRPLPDEAAVRVRIPRGVTPIVALHRRSEERPGGFMIRLRDPSGAPVRGLRLVQPWEGSRCDDGDLLDLRGEFAPEIGPAGEPTASLQLRPSFEGLAPATSRDLVLKATARGGKNEVGRATSSALAGAALRDGSARAALDLPVPKKGEGVIEVAIDGGPRPSLQLKTKSYPRDVHARIAKLLAPSLRERAPAAAVASFEQHVRVLARAAMAPERDARWLDEHTARAEVVAKSLAAGEDPYPTWRGAVFRAYRSKLDGELQPYVAFVPPSAQKGPLPVVFVAHGMDRLPEHALRTLVGEAPDEDMTLDFAAKHLPRFVDQRAILVAPLQFGNAGPHPLGEADLLDVLDDVAKTWAIDPLRVSITGYSLGGTVAFVAPLHYPDRFAAAAPLCGYPNLLGYTSVRSVDKTAWEPALLEAEYIVNWAENGLYLPLHVVHGGKDSPQRSQVVVDAYKSAGQSVVFDVDEEADHNVWDDGYEDGRMVSWLSRKSRPDAPRRVRFVTADLRHDRAYWVRILALDDHALPSQHHAPDLARIDATFDPRSAKLAISTREVASFAIDRAALPDDAGKRKDPGAIQITVDGRDLGTVAADAPIILSRPSPGAPHQLAAALPDLTGKKRHGVSGPLTDAWRDPLIVVRGTAALDLLEANRLVAEHVASAFGTSTLRLPVITDDEATDERLRDHGVVLVGGPASNRLALRWEADLPVKIEPGAVTVRGTRHEGKELAVSAVGPRPGAPDHYVVLHAGMTERATLAVRSLPRYLPDWVVYDARIATERGGLLFGKRPTIAGGFFDSSWNR